MRVACTVLLVLTASTAQSTQLPVSVSDRVQTLQGEMERQLAAGEVDAVRATAAEIRKLHAALPPEHWQRRSGEHLAALFEKLASFDKAQRQSYLEAEQALEQASTASSENKHDQAENALARVLAIHKVLFPAPSHPLADTYRRIAIVLRDGEKLPQASKYSEASLAMLKHLWGEHPWVARAYLLHADLLERLREFDLAEEHFRQGWELARRCLGPRGDLAQGARAALVRLLADQGRARHADAVERVHLLDEVERTLGKEHVDVFAVCQGAAESLDATGDSAAAEPLYRRVLAHHLKSQSPTPETVGVLGNLIRNLVRQNKLDEVEPLARQMLDLQTKLGEEHPGTPTTWFAYGDALLALHQTQPGLEALSRGLELRRKQLGETHAGTINAYNRVGNALDDLGRHAEAEPYFRQALERGLKLAGPNNANVAALRCNLGNCLLNQNKLEEAEKNLSEAVEVLLRLEGGGGPGSATALSNLAGVRLAQQKYDEALKLYTQAHDAIKPVGTEIDPLVVRLYGYMGTTLLQLGKADQAEVLLRRAVEQQRKLGGARSAGHAVALLDLADCRLAAKQPAEAEKLLRQAVTILERTSPGSGELALALSGLGRTLDAQKKPTEAEPLHRRAAGILDSRQTPLARRGKILAAQGMNLHGLGRDADAEPILRRALEATRLNPLTLKQEREEIQQALEQTLSALGMPQGAGTGLSLQPPR